jgi:hypothetical protein
MRLAIATLLLATSTTAFDAAAQDQPAPKNAPPPDVKDTAAADDEPQKPVWDVSVSGYFRAPIMIGVSRRPNPGDVGGERHLQLSHGPNRLVDGDYNSFAYTRLEEGDWAELYVTAKRPHVEATVALMGSWYVWAGYPNGDSGWLPAQAWVDLDTDAQLGSLRPHIDLKAGVFWQRWGMFEKYDTYLFGRFHQAGAALQVDVPFAGGAEARLVEGFGTNRNGSPSAGTGLTLLHYTHLGLKFAKLLNLGVYHNFSWTRDPSLFVPPATELDPAPETPGPNGEPGGGTYEGAHAAHMTVLGADIDMKVPRAGHAWLAASRVSVTNGWALPGIVEVMHSPGGLGVAENYLAWGEAGSTGSGRLDNLSALYENSLRGLGGAPEGSLPDVALSAFGMLAHVQRDLQPEATLDPEVTQLKWGTDLTLKALPWLAAALRFDQVDLDAGHAGQAFRVLSPRITFTTHALATESIWLQYSRYFYDDDVVLASAPGQSYPNPDRNVIKIQANLNF